MNNDLPPALIPARKETGIKESTLLGLILNLSFRDTIIIIYIYVLCYTYPFRVIHIRSVLSILII